MRTDSRGRLTGYGLSEVLGTAKAPQYREKTHPSYHIGLGFFLYFQERILLD